jgi:large subunit ribosomal protein L30e
MEDSEVIKKIVETGEVSLGSRSVGRTGGKAKLIIVAENCPRNLKEGAEKLAKPTYVYKGSSLALGELCGKPFPVAAMAVMNAGQANLSQLLKGAKD